jgi:hypothetical protein
MKTTMQELINWIECDNDNNVYDILDMAKELLEKEREQIIKAANQNIAGDEMLDLLYFPGKEAAKSKGEAYYRLMYEGKTNKDICN